MLLSEMITRVRERSRTNSDFVADSVIANGIDEATKAFVQITGGLLKGKYLDIEPKFWTSTTMAFALTITGGANALAATDIVITDTDRNGVSGAQVATDLQAKIREESGVSTLTVTFSTTTWKFTIDTIDGTAIEIAAPSAIIYADCTDILFGRAGSESASTWVSDIPEDSTVEVDLPTDYLRPKVVEWDRIPLSKASGDVFTSPGVSGEPVAYQVRPNEKALRLYPTPRQQKLLWLRYYYSPATIRDFQGYQENGLSGKLGTTSTGLSTSTPYSIKLTIDGGTQAEYNITTASDVTYAAVIVLLNAATTGVATFSLVDGDLRCTSDTQGTGSTVSQAAGTTHTNLYATLTGWSAFETAVSVLTAELDFDDEAEPSVLLLASGIACEEAGDIKKAEYFLARGEIRAKLYKRSIQNQDAKYRTHSTAEVNRRRTNYRVTI